MQLFAGAALDAAQRGLRVACIEREDFSSGTSSRSTKLLWGGSRYLVQAFVSLLSTKLFTSPVETVKRFKEDFHMVMNCHRERRFMLQEQPHLTKWLPIAVPFDKWFLVPPPFGFFPAIFGPLGLFPAFFKFVSDSSASSSQRRLYLPSLCSQYRCFLCSTML
jgi:glycerol-3-phosphate dehydrogenase